MPITVNELIKRFDLPTAKKVKWDELISTEQEGIYIVSLSNNPNLNSGNVKDIPISKGILKKWVEKVGGFEIDKTKTFDINLITDRLSESWLPDENILYIGKAPKRKNGKALGNRVREFYRTEYGERKPHAGGHWLKSLYLIDELFVYYTTCTNSSEIELNLLSYFCENISNDTRKLLRDKELTLPFANLELKKGQIKKHGLSKMKK